jgi:hypothetical protein
MMMSGLYGDPSNACTATSGWQMNIVGKLQRALFATYGAITGTRRENAQALLQANHHSSEITFLYLLRIDLSQANRT